MNDHNEGKGSQERRAHTRIPVSLDIRFFHSDVFHPGVYTGKVSNISEKGMFIHTKNCLPVGTVLIVIIRKSNIFLSSTVTIQRLEGEDMNCLGLGVELLDPSIRYTKLVKNLKTGK